MTKKIKKNTDVQDLDFRVQRCIFGYTSLVQYKFLASFFGRKCAVCFLSLIINPRKPWQTNAMELQRFLQYLCPLSLSMMLCVFYNIFINDVSDFYLLSLQSLTQENAFGRKSQRDAMLWTSFCLSLFFFCTFLYLFFISLSFVFFFSFFFSVL